jgi:hypothetical protein
MKKRTRVSLLVFTIVATLAAFGALWYTMPGSPSYILDEAKARQNKPLLEVQEPAIQAPPIDINLDYNAITAKVKESLVEDDGFSNVMAKSVSSSASALVDTKLDTFRSEIDTKLSQQSVDLLAKLDSKIANNNEELRNLIENNKTYQSQIDSINTKIININSNLEKYAADVNDPSNYSVDITKYIPQIVDAILPEVAESVLLSVDDNKAILFSDIYSAAGNNELTDEEFNAVFSKYRESIVKEITNQVLDDIEAQVTKDIDMKLAEQATKEVTSVEPVVVPEAPVEPVAVTTPPAPTFKETEDDSKTYIKSNTISIIATSDGSNIQTGEKDLTKTIAIPTFAETPSVTVLDPAEYEAKRAAIREKAINDILDMIK